MVADFRRRFWVSLALTVPVLALSPELWELFGRSPLVVFAGDRFVLFALATAIYFYGGWPFLKGLAAESRKRQPGMMTLIAVAISAAYFYSSAIVFGLAGMGFYWELATLIVIMLLGHWIEMRSVMGASGALEALVAAAWGILLTPAMGAVLMSLSTVIVAINARLLSADVAAN
jgi:P-type Cu2+ transporter